MAHAPAQADPVDRPRPNAGVLNIAPYVPGMAAPDGQGPVYKLSANESALGPSPLAVAAFQDTATRLADYPDGGATHLRQAIGEVTDLDPALIVCGAGSDEILQLLTRAYLAPGDEIVMSRHGFSIYHIFATAVGAQTRFAAENDLTADVDNLLAEVTDRTRILFLANPNNPTGTMLPRAEITRLRAGLRSDVLLVLDGAYAEYVTDPAYEAGDGLVDASVANGLENVVMTRTFSKIYGLGGLRLGWAYCPPSVADVLNRLRGPFNVSRPAMYAGAAAIRDLPFTQENRAFTNAERDRLASTVSGLGIGMSDSVANFLLLRLPEGRAGTPVEMAGALFAHLRDGGVITRQMGGYFLPDALRVSIGSTPANDRFLDLLTDFVQKKLV